MSEPYGQHGRVLAGIVLVTLLAGSLVWAGATTGDLTETAYPNEADVLSDRAGYVGERVVLSGFVVETDPVVIATLASGDGRFTLEEANAHLRTDNAPLERGDQVTAFGTLEDESTLAVERSMTRESSETRYMVLASALGGLWVAGRVVRHWRFDLRTLAFVSRDRPRDARSGLDGGDGPSDSSADRRAASGGGEKRA